MSGSNTNPAINIVTIDFVIKSCMAIRDNALQGGTYHITNNQPLAIQMIIDNFAVPKYKLHGITIASSDSFKITPENPIEQQFNSSMQVYLPYMQDERIFVTENTDRVLKQLGIECPEITAEILERCIDYAESMNWKDPLLKVEMTHLLQKQG